MLQPVPAAGVTPTAAGTYIVKRGDTLYSIALEHGADYRELAQLNKLDDPSRIRVGQELRIAAPEARSAAQVGAARAPRAIESRPLDSGTSAGSAAPAADGSMKTSPQALRLPYSEQNVAMLSKGDSPPPPTAAPQVARIEVKPEPPKPTPDRAADSIDLVWPAKGKVIGTFSEPRSKGIDIAGNLGDPVIAAAPGRVIYVGSGIPGLGKFIVIRHENGFNTVYGHNREIIVKMDQSISRGQKIAELGNTDSEIPKLHFQIRKFGAALDPLKYLPPS